MTYTSRMISVAISEGNKFTTKNELRVEVLRLGHEVVDLRAVSEEAIHEIEPIASLQEIFQRIEQLQEGLIIALKPSMTYSKR